MPYWTVRRLALWFYPFTALTVAINLYFIGLMWQALGLPAIPPVTAILISIPLGVPATWWVARWIRGLMDEAER